MDRIFCAGRGLLNLGLALVLAGCAHYPLNAPLARYDPAAGYRFRPAPDGDGVAVFLFFSGGGTRAAAFSYGTLQALAGVHPFAQRPDRALLSDVELISAVSGGSVTAAYYCLYGDRTFRDFDRRFLKRDVQDILIRECLEPANWVRFSSANFGRSELAAEFFDRELFDHATFAQLMAPGGHRPFLIVNATDIATGIGFGFTQDQFDLIYSDLASFPIARAVAASSAVPLLLTPVTLRNYSGPAGRADPAWLPPVDEKAVPAGMPPDLGRLLRSYLDGQSRPYVHLVDGGFSDNLGLVGIYEVSMASGGLDHLLATLKARHDRRLVFIVVDASVDRAANTASKSSPPGMLSVLGALGDSVEKHAGVALTSLIRRQVVGAFQSEEEKARAAAGVPSLPAAADPFEFYFVSVSFDDLGDGPEKTFFKALPSNFNLPPATVDRLSAAGGRLLRQSAEYQRLLRDLAAEKGN